MTTMGNRERECPGGGVGAVLSMESAHNRVHFHKDEHQNWYQHHHHHLHNAWFPTTLSSSSRIRLAVNSSATVNLALTSATFPQIPSSSSLRFDLNVFPAVPTLTIPAKRKQIHCSPVSFREWTYKTLRVAMFCACTPGTAPLTIEGEIKGNKGFVFLNFYIFSFRFAHISSFLIPRSRWSLICPSFFHLRSTKHFEITRQQHLYTPITRFSSTSNANSPKLSAELRPPDPTISDNDKDESPPNLGEDRCIVSLMR